MFKKSFGKILFFVFNIFLLIGGVLFIKNRESKKTVEFTNTPDSGNIETSAEIIQNSEPISPGLPIAEEKSVNNINDNNSTATSISVPIPSPAPAASVSTSTSNAAVAPTPSKPKTKAS